MRRLFPFSLAAAFAVLVASPAYAAAAQTELAGVWDGTIGNLPVRVCFNHHDYGMTGGYYYRSHLQAIWLDGSDDKGRRFVEGGGEPDPTTPRWSIDRADGRTISGRWTQGAKALPIALKRQHLTEKESPCSSMLFQGPRLEGVRTISKLAVKDGVPYTRRILDHRGHFGQDVSVETFALNDDSPAARIINAELRKPLSGEPDGWFECIRMAWDSSSTGYSSQTLSPHMISKRWLVVVDENGWACGGAHPDDYVLPRLFDRQTGKQVDLDHWLNAKAEIPKDQMTALRAEFRSLILGQHKTDSGCLDVVKDVDYWAIELTRTGLIFTPGLPHVDEGCREEYLVSFAKLQSYLSPEGKAEIAALQAEAANRR